MIVEYEGAEVVGLYTLVVGAWYTLDVVTLYVLVVGEVYMRVGE